MQHDALLAMRWPLLGAVLCLVAGSVALACSVPDVDDPSGDGVRLPERHSASADIDGEAPSGNNGTDVPTNGDGPGANDGGKPATDSGTTPPPPPPPPPPPCGELKPGEQLTTNQSRKSCDNRFTLVMQGDGNLVLYKNNVGALWSSNTANTSGNRAVMQGDGNFVLYDAGNSPLFHTSTNGHPGAWLAIQNDGNLVVYENGVPLWASNTAGN